VASDRRCNTVSRIRASTHANDLHSLGNSSTNPRRTNLFSLLGNLSLAKPIDPIDVAVPTSRACTTLSKRAQAPENLNSWYPFKSGDLPIGKRRLIPLFAFGEVMAAKLCVFSVIPTGLKFRRDESFNRFVGRLGQGNLWKSEGSAVNSVL
jgi:hypothetical protein